MTEKVVTDTSRHFTSPRRGRRPSQRKDRAEHQILPAGVRRVAGQNVDTEQVAAADAFRGKVRAFLAAELTPELALAPRTSQLISAEPQQRWHRILADRGWAVPSWPEPFGGTSWSAEQHRIFQDELGAANAPPLSPFLEMVGRSEGRRGGEGFVSTVSSRVLPA